MADCPLLDYEESTISYVRQLQGALANALDALEPFAKMGALEKGSNIDEPIYAKMTGAGSASVSKFDFIEAASVMAIAKQTQPNQRPGLSSGVQRSKR